jgi:PAS domain S-box-containing protein
MDKTQILWNLIEGTNDMIFSVTKEGGFEYANKAFLRKLKYSDDELVKIALKDVAFPGSLNRLRELQKQALSGREVFDEELTFCKSDGEMIDVSGNLVPRYEGGVPVAVMGIFRDITERRKTEQEIQASQSKVEFLLDIMTHDMTNINQEILSTLELLSFDPGLRPDLKTLINESMAELERSSMIISNVKKISIVESGEKVAEERDLGDAIYRASLRSRASHPQKKLKLVNGVKLHTYFIKSNAFLVDVFYELFSNSMRFDEKDEVIVEVTASPIRHTPFLRVEVSDYGRGIPDTEKDAIFNKEIQRKDSIKGLGLGLTLVKRIVESFGGYIRVEDRVQLEPDKGAKFVLLLRYSEEEQNGATGDV